jgi:hypothetical protein
MLTRVLAQELSRAECCRTSQVAPPAELIKFPAGKDFLFRSHINKDAGEGETVQETGDLAGSGNSDKGLTLDK